MVKEQFRQTHLAKKISHVQFGMFSEADVRRASHVAVTDKELFSMPLRTPKPLGPLDRHMVGGKKVLPFSAFPPIPAHLAIFGRQCTLTPHVPFFGNNILFYFLVIAPNRGYLTKAANVRLATLI